jgi:uncharacterized protein (TIGR03437 family)
MKHSDPFWYLAALVICLELVAAEKPGFQSSRSIRQVEIPNRYRNLPLSFEPNRGQVNAEILFVAQGTEYTALLAADGLVWRDRARRKNALRLKFVNANPRSRATGQDPLTAISSYFIGNDSGRWRTGIPHYARVKYQDIYPGIDVIFYGERQRLEYDFVLAPGADPRKIGIAFDGAEAVELDGSGDLLLRTAGGSLKQRAPRVYQQQGTLRHAVECRYRLDGRNQIGFQPGAFDKRRPLVIDPVLSYSGLLGGSGDDSISNVVVDASGSAYIVGSTTSMDIPSQPGALRVPPGGGPDVFVTKLNAAGTAVVYSAFFGGSQADAGTGTGIAINSAGEAYVTGTTQSSDFPTTPAALRRESNAGSFVTKLNATGTMLAYSTYLDNVRAEAYAIAVDDAANAYVAGTTFSTDFPTTPGAFQTVLGGSNDAFLAKLNATGSAFVYSTFLGGSDIESASSVAVDHSGNVYITGGGKSVDFPTTPGAFQTEKAPGESEDAFVAKVNAAGSQLVYASYLGGSGAEGAFDIVIDGSTNAYLTGITSSTDFPSTSGAFQRALRGGSDAFVTKLNPQGSKLVYSTYLGGRGADNGTGIAVDSAGKAYVLGNTISVDFPLTPDASQIALRGPGDTFVVKLSAAGDALDYATLVGGTEGEGANGIALDPAGNAYVVGATASKDFPVTKGALPITPGGSVPFFAEAFVAKLEPGGIARPIVTSVSAATFAPGFAPESIASAFGEGLAGTSEQAKSLPLPTTLASVTVTIRDTAGVEHLAPLFYVSPDQVNYLIPQDVAVGEADLTVTRDGTRVGLGLIRVNTVAPGLFTANSDGRGVAAAVAVKVARDGTQTPQVIFRCGTAAGSCVGVPIDFGSPDDRVVLSLFGTGIRHANDPGGVTVIVQGEELRVQYAGPQGAFAGLDQVNVTLPRSLAGTGELQVFVSVPTDQQSFFSNQVTIQTGEPAALEP